MFQKYDHHFIYWRKFVIRYFTLKGTVKEMMETGYMEGEENTW